MIVNFCKLNDKFSMILPHEYLEAFIFPQIGHNCNNYINLSSEQIDVYMCLLVIYKKRKHVHEFENKLPQQFENSFIYLLPHTHTQKMMFAFCKIEPYLNFNHIFPIKLAPNGN